MAEPEAIALGCTRSRFRSNASVWRPTGRPAPRRGGSAGYRSQKSAAKLAGHGVQNSRCVGGIRAHLIRERTQAGLAAALRVGRTGGRPPELTDDDIEAAKAMLANPDISMAQIAHRVGVSPATLYRYIPAARTANTPRRLTTAALLQRPDAPGGFLSGGWRRLSAP
jgi:hypothetical protein